MGHAPSHKLWVKINLALFSMIRISPTFVESGNKKERPRNMQCLRRRVNVKASLKILILWLQLLKATGYETQELCKLRLVKETPHNSSQLGSICNVSRFATTLAAAPLLG
jgi:hypothetical protein